MGQIIVVSGLPRSGTSLMMQMLAAAGVPIQQDAIRAADASNPRGYFEWERIKQLPQRPELIEDCEAKAVKVISSLLTSLPQRFDYRIVFLERRFEDMLASQAKMIERLGARGGSLAAKQMIQALATHRNQVYEWLEKRRHPVAKVAFESLFDETFTTIALVRRFLGLGEGSDAMMARVIEPQLRHVAANSFDRSSTLLSP